MSFAINDTCLDRLEFEKAMSEYFNRKSDADDENFDWIDSLEERYGSFYDFPEELIEKFKKDSCYNFHKQTKNKQESDIRNLLIFGTNVTFEDEDKDIYEYFLRKGEVEKRIIWDNEIKGKVSYY